MQLKVLLGSMGYNYFYFDDDPLEIIKGIARSLSVRKELVEVTPIQPGLWKDVKAFLLEKQDEFSGLLLDWKLKNENEDGVIADFNAAALAQQLRVLSVDKLELRKDFPIVLCSAEMNFYEVYKKEKTIHDLFDLVYSKDYLADENEVVIRQLESLANAYSCLNSSKSIQDLGIVTEKYDERFIEGLCALFNNDKISHLIIKYLLDNFILNNGILIDEFVLGARLGVDIEKSDADSWSFIKSDVLQEVRYTGILSDGWDRWDQSALISFWNTNFQQSLASLNAEKRVEMLNDTFNLRLTPASVLEYNVNSNFWYVCEATKKPISYDEAILKKKSENIISWLDNKYFSLKESFSLDLNKDIDLIDRERVVFLKKKFSNEVVRNKARH